MRIAKLSRFIFHIVSPSPHAFPSAIIFFSNSVLSSWIGALGSRLSSAPTSSLTAHSPYWGHWILPKMWPSSHVSWCHRKQHYLLAPNPSCFLFSFAFGLLYAISSLSSLCFLDRTKYSSLHFLHDTVHVFLWAPAIIGVWRWFLISPLFCWDHFSLLANESFWYRGRSIHL